jgi:hypothetical protein
MVLRLWNNIFGIFQIHHVLTNFNPIDLDRNLKF